MLPTPRARRRRLRAEGVGVGGLQDLEHTESKLFTRLDCGSGVVRYEKCLICNRLLVWNVPAMIFLF